MPIDYWRLVPLARRDSPARFWLRLRLQATWASSSEPSLRQLLQAPWRGSTARRWLKSRPLTLPANSEPPQAPLFPRANALDAPLMHRHHGLSSLPVPPAVPISDIPITILPEDLRGSHSPMPYLELGLSDTPDASGNTYMVPRPVPDIRDLVAAHRTMLYGKHALHLSKYEFIRQPDNQPAVCIIGRRKTGKTVLVDRLVSEPVARTTFAQVDPVSDINIYKIGPQQQSNKSSGILRIFDVPGVGHNNNEQHIKTMGVNIFRKRKLIRGSIMLVNALQGLRDVERDLMTEIAVRGHPFVVVLNKAELLVPQPNEEDYHIHLWYYLLDQAKKIHDAAVEVGAAPYMRSILVSGRNQRLFFGRPIGLLGIKYAILRLAGLVGEDNWGKPLCKKNYEAVDTASLDIGPDARVESISPQNPYHHIAELLGTESLAAKLEKAGLDVPQHMRHIVWMGIKDTTSYISRWQLKIKKDGESRLRKSPSESVAGPRRYYYLDAQLQKEYWEEWESKHGTVEEQRTRRLREARRALRFEGRLPVVKRDLERAEQHLSDLTEMSSKTVLGGSADELRLARKVKKAAKATRKLQTLYKNTAIRAKKTSGHMEDLKAEDEPQIVGRSRMDSIRRLTNVEEIPQSRDPLAPMPKGRRLLMFSRKQYAAKRKSSEQRMSEAKLLNTLKARRISKTTNIMEEDYFKEMMASSTLDKEAKPLKQNWRRQSQDGNSRIAHPWLL